MLEEIVNFLPLDEKLLTSGMPTSAQLADAAHAGVQVVINLAMPDSERALPNEAAVVESLGMQYIGIPVEWEHPTRSDLDQFMQVMASRQGSKLLVHCQANYRATAFVTLDRILRLGWEPERALKDLRRVWNPDEYPVWKKFLVDNLPQTGRGANATRDKV